MAKCCINCFSDVGLKVEIGRTAQMGRCGYCGTNGIQCTEPENLSDILEIVMYNIEPSNDGQKLSEILDDSYGIFGPQVRDKSSLTSSIFGIDDNTSTYRINFNALEYTSQWENFSLELKEQNRFFPRNTIYSSLFTPSDGEIYTRALFSLLEQLTHEIFPDERLYRARISDAPLSSDNMGAPPCHLASAGRANPVGIPYLYLSKDIDTCIAEVRPSNAHQIYVSEFFPKSELSILDLTNPRKAFSITQFEETQASETLRLIELLEKLSRELSKPILPNRSEIDYIPTQFVCEFIKNKANLRGIAFKSSFDKKTNYVFFYPDDFTNSTPNLYEIESTIHKKKLVQG